VQLALDLMMNLSTVLCMKITCCSVSFCFMGQACGIANCNLELSYDVWWILRCQLTMFCRLRKLTQRDPRCGMIRDSWYW
jgi:hypothetical protein